jgi:hypothetical protein
MAQTKWTWALMMSASMMTVTSTARAESATAPDGFARAKAAAVVPEHLNQVVASIVGACPDGLMADELEACQKNLAAAKDVVQGKTTWVQLASASPIVLEKRSADGHIRLAYSPLVDVGNGFAITVGAPLKASPAGTVVVATKPVEGTSDKDLQGSDIERAIRTQQVGIEAVVKFKNKWQLNSAKGPLRGVAVEVVAIRFFHTRTNQTILSMPAS